MNTRTRMRRMRCMVAAAAFARRPRPDMEHVVCQHSAHKFGDEKTGSFYPSEVLARLATLRPATYT